MCHWKRAIVALIAPFCVWSACLRAQTSEAKKKAESPTVTVQPVQVDLLSLQVSKLPRDGFGHGIKPGTNENVSSWLANSGTAVDLRLALDRPIGRFDEQASRLIRFADDRGGDLAQPPRGVYFDPFFPDNKPMVVKLGPAPQEAEVILRGFGTPAPGGTKLRIDADLVFLAVSGEQTAERKGLEPTPGTTATIGPLRLSFKDPQQAMPLGAPPAGPMMERLAAVRRAFGPQAGPLGGPLSAPVSVAPGAMPVAFDYERLERPIKSVACLNTEGRGGRDVAGQCVHP